MCKNFLEQYETSLYLEEKSDATIQKYVRIIQEFLTFAEEKELSKELLLQYKRKLSAKHEPSGVNAKLAALNGFLKFLGKPEYCLKYVKIQRKLFMREDRELTKKEYLRLRKAAGRSQTYYMMETILGTGIRISELEAITVEAVKRGEVYIDCKNKVRQIFLPNRVCQLLKEYIRKNHIKSGCIFRGKTGKPLDRTVAWRKMKKLCEQANVSPKKVFPHNLRHLFARMFYELEKDIVRLADILGHSSIQTTRIYTCEAGKSHKKGLERVQNALKTV